jgi:hypothetical protein
MQVPRMNFKKVKQDIPIVDDEFTINTTLDLRGASLLKSKKTIDLNTGARMWSFGDSIFKEYNPETTVMNLAAHIIFRNYLKNALSLIGNAQRLGKY